MATDNFSYYLLWWCPVEITLANTRIALRILTDAVSRAIYRQTFAGRKLNKRNILCLYLDISFANFLTSTTFSLKLTKTENYGSKCGTKFPTWNFPHHLPRLKESRAVQIAFLSVYY
jgi:hypothetical protein